MIHDEEERDAAGTASGGGWLRPAAFLEAFSEEEREALWRRSSSPSASAASTRTWPTGC